jgi:hypothetical protein
VAVERRQDSLGDIFTSEACSGVAVSRIENEGGNLIYMTIKLVEILKAG